MKKNIKTDKIILNLLNFLALSIPLLLGILFDNIRLSVIGALGALIFNYYVPQSNKKGLKTVLIKGVVIILAYILILILNGLPWLTPIIVGVLGGIFFFYNKSWNLIGPGPFFLVMISSMAGTQTYIDYQTALLSTGFLTIGVGNAIVLSAIGEYIFSYLKLPKLPDQTKKFKLKMSELPTNIIIQSIFYGITIFLAFYLGQNLKLFNYYWVVVACSAVLKAETTSHAIQRHTQYIIGAIVGCSLSYLLLAISLETSQIMLILLVLNSLIYWLINKNYLLGNFFTTPMAILLFRLITPTLSNGAIIDRFIAILIGTTLGLASIFIFESLNKKLDQSQ